MQSNTELEIVSEPLWQRLLYSDDQLMKIPLINVPQVLDVTASPSPTTPAATATMT